MSESSLQIPSGVVVDDPMARALLYASVRESLVDGEPSIGDGFVRMLMSRPPSEQLLANAFEQLILGGKLFVPFWLPPDWKGQLFEEQGSCP